MVGMIGSEVVFSNHDNILNIQFVKIKQGEKMCLHR